MKGETTVDDRCTDQTVAREALPRAHTNGRGGPGAYVNSMAPTLAIVQPSGPPCGGGADFEAASRAPARVPESPSLRRLRHLDLTRSVAGCPYNPRNLCRSRDFHHGMTPHRAASCGILLGSGLVGEL